jgi:predicted MPP superfamily phosphohydrolase
MEFARKWAMTAGLSVLAVGLHIYLARRLSGGRAPLRVSIWLAGALAVGAMFNAQLPSPAFFTVEAVAWTNALAMFWLVAAGSLAFWAWLRPRAARRDAPDPVRRRLLRLAVPAAAAAPAALAGAGILIARIRIELREAEVPIPNLPRDLHGLRIALLSDVHYGPFLGRNELARAVAMMNENRPHAAVLAGDLITRPGDNLAACIEVLRGLRAEAGVFGCHGNHELYAGLEDEAARLGAGAGFRFLRGEQAVLPFGGAWVNLAGVGYQPMKAPYLAGSERLVRQGGVNVLLSHNPDVFPTAAALGFDLTLSGHTHGGQVNFGAGGSGVNVARLFTPYTHGLYRENGRSVYVTAGLGTVGVPVRLGAPPEVSILKLCAA